MWLKGAYYEKQGTLSKLRNFLGILCKELGTTAKHIFVFYHFIEVEKNKEKPTFILAYMQASMLGCVQLFVASRTVAHQAALSMEFSRQEY